MMTTMRSALLWLACSALVVVVVVACGVCVEGEELCVSTAGGVRSLVFAVEDAEVLAAISGFTDTTPAHPDHVEVGVDVAAVPPSAAHAMTCRAGRAVVHRFICARHDKAEEAVAAFPLGAYGHLGPACVHMTVHRTNASGVCQPRHAASPCPTNSVPLPTLAQQRYQRHEIVGLTHFNMATFVHNGDPACSSTNWNQGVNCSNPAVFNPVKLDIDNWIASYKALGAKHAVLTAKHGCGFLLWSTNTSLPNGRPYGYGVQRPNIPSFPRDVVLEFSTKMQAAGLGHGFYYSTGNNFYLNRIDFKPAGALLPGQVNVTDKEYNTLVFEHVRELWSRYGNLTEIWFDHGYAGDQKAALQQLLQQYQPHAAGFNGYGIMPSPVKWCGTESGTPPRGIWSTGCDASSGNPNATSYCPTGVDTTLQDFDTWFWMPGVPIRSLDAMMDVYHASVGNNGVLELDFAINRDGLVDATHAVLYKQLGDWIRTCYGTPLANASATGTTVTLTFQQPVTTDRFMLQEAFESGERVRAWRIDVQEKNQQQMRRRHEGGGHVQAEGAREPNSSSEEEEEEDAWKSVASGTVIGYKQIVLLDGGSTTITSARLTITSAAMTPLIRTFAAFAPCKQG